MLRMRVFSLILLSILETNYSVDISALNGTFPTWTRTIPNLYNNYTIAFINLFDDSLNKNNINGKNCKLTSNIFGRRCGFCQDDCNELISLSINNIIAPSQQADIILVSPELSQRTSLDPINLPDRLTLISNLPIRNINQYYFIHKMSIGLATNEDCGRFWSISPLNPNYIQKKVRKQSLPFSSTHNDSNIVLSPFCSLLYRRDIIWGDIDVGEHDLDDDEISSKLISVTLPPGGWNDKHHYHGTDLLKRFSFPPKYLAWFKGKCHGGTRSKCKKYPERCTPQQLANSIRHGGKVSNARYEMSQAFKNESVESPSSVVLLEWAGTSYECPGIGQMGKGTGYKEKSGEGDTHSIQGEEKYFDTMVDTHFGFVIHGDVRWNLRFLELLSAGTIPVIIADGLKLPFEQLIDWNSFVLYINESVIDSRNVSNILKPLHEIAMKDIADEDWSFPQDTSTTTLLNEENEKQQQKKNPFSKIEKTNFLFYKSRELRRRSAFALSVYQTYFSTANKRTEALLASLGGAFIQAKERDSTLSSLSPFT